VTTTTITASERRKRLRLKRIVVSEQNYVALKQLGGAGDSFMTGFQSYCEYIGTMRRAQISYILLLIITIASYVSSLRP
jgi:hypothetical protein